MYRDIRVMMSKNDEALKEVASYATNRYASGSIEVHAGLLAYFNSAEQAEAYVTQSDYIEFNGLSAKFF
jgi:viroplasmin and RNaseH domain-containing protein